MFQLITSKTKGLPWFSHISVCFFAAMALLPSIASAQIISETQWFFGQSSANLQFDKNGFNVYEEDRMNVNFGTGGPAVVSDPWTGNLWFYSDGVNVYDASHAVAPGGSNLNGNPDINQAAVVAPSPLTQGLYYLFTNSGTTGINDIEYVLLDATAVGNGTTDAPLGSVISSPASTGLTNPAEGMIIILSQSQPIYWLISQNRNNYDFRVTRIDAGGVGITQTFALDTATAIPGAEAARFD